jgi:hypothetical protein
VPRIKLDTRYLTQHVRSIKLPIPLNTIHFGGCCGERNVQKLSLGPNVDFAQRCSRKRNGGGMSPCWKACQCVRECHLRLCMRARVCALVHTHEVRMCYCDMCAVPAPRSLSFPPQPPRRRPMSPSPHPPLCPPPKPQPLTRG